MGVDDIRSLLVQSSCTTMTHLKATSTKDKDAKGPVTTKRKVDLIAAVATSTGMTKSDCETCINALLDTIVEVRFCVVLYTHVCAKSGRSQHCVLFPPSIHGLNCP